MKTIAQQIKWDFKTNGYLEIKDNNGKEIYYERSSGYWVKWEYDSQGNQIYCENSSHGVIEDKRPKSCEVEEIIIDGVKYKLIKQ